MNHPFPENMARSVLPHSDSHLKNIEKKKKFSASQAAEAINNGATALTLTTALANYQKSKSDSINDALMNRPLFFKKNN